MEPTPVPTSDETAPQPKPKRKDSLLTYVLWAVVFFCVISLLSQGYSRYQLASQSMAIVKDLPDSVRVRPVEEEWQPAEGTTLDLGYATLVTPPGALLEVNGLLNDMIVLLQFEGGLGLMLATPTLRDSTAPEPVAGEPDKNQPVYLSFDESRAICLAQPKNFWGYFMTKPDDLNAQLTALQQKARIGLLQNGAILFTAPAVQGVLQCGNDTDPRQLCEIWDKTQPVHQIVTLGKTQAALTAPDVQLAKQIVASMRYQSDLTGNPEAIARRCSEAIRMLPNYRAIQVNVTIPPEVLEKLKKEQQEKATVPMTPLTPQNPPVLSPAPVLPAPIPGAQP